MLEPAVEEYPFGSGRALVEGEGELVEMVGRVLLVEAAVRGSSDPGFQQGGDLVDLWYLLVAVGGVAANVWP
jgi:hypothetical protein